MELFLSLLGGASSKVYDDIVDLNWKVTDTTKESLKGLQWMILALLSVRDFNFAIILYGMNLCHHFANENAFKQPYESSLLYLFPFLLLLSFPTSTAFTMSDLLVIVPLIGVMILEPVLIKEDVSFRKMMSRLALAIGTFMIVLIGGKFHVSTSIIKLAMYYFGYCFISFLVQAYIVYTKKDPRNI